MIVCLDTTIFAILILRAQIMICFSQSLTLFTASTLLSPEEELWSEGLQANKAMLCFVFLVHFWAKKYEFWRSTNSNIGNNFLPMYCHHIFAIDRIFLPLLRIPAFHFEFFKLCDPVFWDVVGVYFLFLSKNRTSFIVI